MQYTIVFAIQFVTMLVLTTMSCVPIQSVYGMTDTALGNAGLNSKPIDSAYFNDAKCIIEPIDTKFRYRNIKNVVDAIEKYAQGYLSDIKKDYKWDVKYSLVQDGVLTDKTYYYNMNPGSYHEILDTEVRYYADNLPNTIKGMDVEINKEEVSESIDKLIKNDLNTDKKEMEHFVKVMQDYLVEQGTLSELDIVEITEELEHMKNGGMQEFLSNMYNKVVSGTSKDGTSDRSGKSEAARSLDALFDRLRILDMVKHKDINENKHTPVII